MPSCKRKCCEPCPPCNPSPTPIPNVPTEEYETVEEPVGLPPFVNHPSLTLVDQPLFDTIKINDKYEDDIANDWFSKPPLVSGCTDPTAENYNPAATQEDGSCTYAPVPVLGCTDPAAENYDPTATQDDGSCTYCIPSQPEIQYQAAHGEIQYEPAQYQLDTRISNTRIPHDFLWALETNFAYNFHSLIFTRSTTTSALRADTSPDNLTFYALRPGSTWATRWDAITPTNPDINAIPPNPDATFYTERFWYYAYRAKWRQIYQIPNYGIERYQTLPVSADTASYISIFDRQPLTGFNNGSVQSVAALTSKYNDTIHYKLEYTLDETKENTYMFYFKETRYLPDSIQSAVTGSDLHAQFTPWSGSDVTEFKQWASANATTRNKYYTGPEILYQAASPEIPYSPAVIGTCPEPEAPLQYTPSAGVEAINTATTISQASFKVFSQDPNGIGWILPAFWDAAVWDGIPYDTTGKTKEEICAWLKPSEDPNVIRGIREKFYEVNPFADNENPTALEINQWNFEVVRHIRAMLGGGNEVHPDARLFLEARWADERKHTTQWDTAYPFDPPGGPYGPCVGSTDTAGGHCGASFFPDEPDRAAYISAEPYNNDLVKYPELNGNGPGANFPVMTTTGYTLRRSAAEGISGIAADVPWSIKLAVIITNWICSEGLTGHPGPFVPPGRREMGFSWWFVPPNTMSFRAKHAN